MDRSVGHVRDAVAAQIEVASHRTGTVGEHGVGVGFDVDRRTRGIVRLLRRPDGVGLGSQVPGRGMVAPADRLVPRVNIRAHDARRRAGTEHRIGLGEGGQVASGSMVAPAVGLGPLGGLYGRDRSRHRSGEDRIGLYIDRHARRDVGLVRGIHRIGFGGQVSGFGMIAPFIGLLTVRGFCRDVVGNDHPARIGFHIHGRAGGVLRVRLRLEIVEVGCRSPDRIGFSERGQIPRRRVVAPTVGLGPLGSFRCGDRGGHRGGERGIAFHVHGRARGDVSFVRRVDRIGLAHQVAHGPMVAPAVGRVPVLDAGGTDGRAVGKMDRSVGHVRDAVAAQIEVASHRTGTVGEHGVGVGFDVDRRTRGIVRLLRRPDGVGLGSQVPGRGMVAPADRLVPRVNIRAHDARRRAGTEHRIGLGEGGQVASGSMVAPAVGLGPLGGLYGRDRSRHRSGEDRIGLYIDRHARRDVGLVRGIHRIGFGGQVSGFGMIAPFIGLLTVRGFCRDVVGNDHPARIGFHIHGRAGGVLRVRLRLEIVEVGCRSPDRIGFSERGQIPRRRVVAPTVGLGPLGSFRCGDRGGHRGGERGIAFHVHGRARRKTRAQIGPRPATKGGAVVDARSPIEVERAADGRGVVNAVRDIVPDGHALDATGCIRRQADGDVGSGAIGLLSDGDAAEGAVGQAPHCQAVVISVGPIPDFHIITTANGQHVSPARTAIRTVADGHIGLNRQRPRHRVAGALDGVSRGIRRSPCIAAQLGTDLRLQAVAGHGQ